MLIFCTSWRSAWNLAAVSRPPLAHLAIQKELLHESRQALAA